MKYKILLVEDDQNLGFIINDQLKKNGFEVLWDKNGDQAKKDYLIFEPHICILDVMLPGSDGFAIAEYIRSNDTHTPILFLTALDLEENVLKGFKAGGDDYITKPFSMDELVHRINVFLRRSFKPQEEIHSNLYENGLLQIDFSKNQLKNSTQSYSLTDKESQILKMLISSKDRIVKREEILIKIWGDDDYFLGRSMDVFISKIRKYIKDSGPEIINHHAIGFKWEETNNQ